MLHYSFPSLLIFQILFLIMFEDRITFVSSWSSMHMTSYYYRRHARQFRITIRCHLRLQTTVSKSDHVDTTNESDSLSCDSIIGMNPINNAIPMFATSFMPHPLQRGAFLGFRKTSSSSSLLRMHANQVTTINKKTTTTQLESSSAVMPDGGITPCVIRLLGVGGGGTFHGQEET
jgi:hypothetical protein